MRVLFIDVSLTGHHKTYLSSLLSRFSDTCLVFLSNDVMEGVPSICHFNIPFNPNSFFSYLNMIIRLRQVARKFEPEIIHFLYGDAFYRFFGIGLRRLYPKAKIVVTCHQFRRSWLRDFSYRRIGSTTDALVVHTEKLKKYLGDLGIKKVHHVEYPQFGNSKQVDKQEALRVLGVKDEGKKVLLVLGGTRKSKGLDILLNALKHVQLPFHLIIAGKEEYFKRSYILSQIESYRENVSLFLEFLSDEKFGLCLNAADIIVLPYRRSFDGASGPLGEGVWHYKMIVGPAHKSLGDIIRSNHLGKTFKSEDVEDLRDMLCDAIKTEWVPDEKYLEYRQSLDPALFQKKYMKLYSDLTAK